MYDEAIAERGKAIEIEPTHAYAHYGLAVAHHPKEEYGSAAEYYDRAVQLGCGADSESLEALEPYWAH